MAKYIYKGKNKKHRGPAAVFGILLVLAVAVLALVLALLWPTLWQGGDTAPSTPMSTAPTTTTTTPSATQMMEVTTDNLNVRTGPGINFSKLGTLSKGAQVVTLALEGDWYRIQYGDTEAYVSAQYLVLPGTAATTTSGSTTSTTTGTTAPPTYTDRYIDEEGMLQFKTDGHYVQANSYAEGAEIPWALRLVNDWNPMPLGYDTKLQMQSIFGDAGTKQVDGRMMDALKKMLEAGKQYNIGVQSAYRSTSKQSELYWRQVNKWKSTYKDPVQLQTKAGEIVKRPGYSEHNVGLAVDLYGSGDYSLTESFEKTPAYKWLVENCADYGFILRFPKGKESITGVVYEAWHFRYVGDAATAHAIMDNGLCLEEYLAQNKK